MSGFLPKVGTVCFSNTGPSAFRKLLFACEKAKDLHLETFTFSIALCKLCILL